MGTQIGRRRHESPGTEREGQKGKGKGKGPDLRLQLDVL